MITARDFVRYIPWIKPCNIHTTFMAHTEFGWDGLGGITYGALDGMKDQLGEGACSQGYR